MNFIKRAFLSIKRNSRKYSLLFVLVLLLGSLASGAVSIQQAVRSTEERLIAQIPAIAIIEPDHQAWEDTMSEAIESGEGWESVSHVPYTVEMIHEIGNLSYVRRFDYSLTAMVYSTELIRYINRFPNPEWGIEASEIVDWNSLSLGERGGLERVGVVGIRGSEMIDIETGLIELVEGRLFDEEEQNSSIVMVSEGFAEANDLNIGSTFSLSSYLFGNEPADLGGVQVDTEAILESTLAHKESVVEVVGIFSVIPQINADNLWQNVQWTQDMLNQIYAPNEFVQLHREFIRGAQQVIFDDWEETVENSPQPIFLLNDPRDLRPFAEAAADILPFHWRIGDLTSNLDTVFYSMEMMNWIADIIFYTALGAAIVIVSLLIVLVLRDRNQEIGLYLALGERKIKVFSQLLLEILTISTMALTLSLVAGNFLSDGLSRIMLQNDLLQQENEIPWIIETTMPELAWHNPGEVSIEEMLELYDTSLDSETVLLFYGIATTTIIFSTLIPMALVLRLNPKKVLMGGGFLR